MKICIKFATQYVKLKLMLQKNKFQEVQFLRRNYKEFSHYLSNTEFLLLQSTNLYTNLII